jgi:hypothetical protein
MLTDCQIQIVPEPLKRRGALESTVPPLLPLHFAEEMPFTSSIADSCSIGLHHDEEECQRTEALETQTAWNRGQR